MKEKGIENGFDENNNQIKPLAMIVKTECLKVLIESVPANGIYRVEVDYVDEHEVIHILLYRKR